MLLSKGLLILLFCTHLINIWHPIYISLCTIEIAKGGEWKGTIKMFYDDLEDALQNQMGERPTLSRERLKDYQPDIGIYLYNHFRIDSEQTSTYEIIDLYRENDLICIDFIGSRKWPPKPVKIFDNIFLELFESQKNIVKIKYRNKDTMYYFKKGVVELNVYPGNS